MFSPVPGVLCGVQREIQWKVYAELCGLFFLQGMAMGAWFVPLSTVLDAHGLQSIKPFAFATSALAAFVSPLIFGAMADRHVAPVRVLRWLALATAGTMTLVALAIQHAASPWLVLVLIQLQALCSAPTWGLANSIVFGRLSNSQRQFGPVRAVATLGWMAGCWVVSALHADTSTVACFVSVSVWLLVSAFTRWLPSVVPANAAQHLTIQQRLGWDALALFKERDHRVVFLTVTLFAIPLAAFYPFAPTHLRELGLERTTAWMTLGQITEIIAMLMLPALLGRWRLKWILGTGLAFGLVRYGLCTLDGKGWVLAGVTLHGFAFTLFFITAQIYLDQRIDSAWRTRAQALYTVMFSGMGNLAGYLGTGWWFQWSARGGRIDWPLFWGGLAVAVAVVLIYFLAAYRGRVHR